MNFSESYSLFMECFSNVFKQAALNSPNVVIGTITFGGDDFIWRIKEREDIDIHEGTEENSNALPDLILQRAARILNLP